MIGRFDDAGGDGDGAVVAAHAAYTECSSTAYMRSHSNQKHIRSFLRADAALLVIVWCVLCERVCFFLFPAAVIRFHSAYILSTE